MEFYANQEAEVNFHKIFARKFILHSPLTATYYKATEKYVKLSEDLTYNVDHPLTFSIRRTVQLAITE